MRSSVRGAGSLLVALALTLVVTSTAVADRHKPLPTKAEVDRARAEVRQKAGDVAAIRAALVIASARLHAAADQAEVASEAYNAARWRLDESRRTAQRAATAADVAQAQVDGQKAGIAALVTQSYQSGTALSSMTALLSNGGPSELMGRVGVVQSVGDSLEARYAEFSAMTILADVAREQAVIAVKAQVTAAERAARLRDRAAAAAGFAQQQAAAIGAERARLITELAAAEKISVDLARKRQRGLEQRAQQHAATAAAENVAAGPEGSDAGGPVVQAGPGLPHALGTRAGADRAIRFARAQLGEPYEWAAAGPDSWDCSGLTMVAWSKGGVALPHYSAAQFQQTKHLTVFDLRPGDLVFWGDSPETIHHVAMYLGDGRIIHAPRTGQPVQISPMYYWEPPNYFGRP